MLYYDHVSAGEIGKWKGFSTSPAARIPLTHLRMPGSLSAYNLAVRADSRLFSTPLELAVGQARPVLLADAPSGGTERRSQAHK